MRVAKAFRGAQLLGLCQVLNPEVISLNVKCIAFPWLKDRLTEVQDDIRLILLREFHCCRVNHSGRVGLRDQRSELRELYCGVLIPHGLLEFQVSQHLFSGVIIPGVFAFLYTPLPCDTDQLIF
jgi:hypothetical protein